MKSRQNIKLLIYTQYYPPETGAPQVRLSELAKYLNNHGFTVSVLTAFPNYPGGKVFPEYKGFYKVETSEGVKIYRTVIKPSLSASLLPRLFSYFSFIFSSFLAGVFLPKIDIILTESPPLFLGVPGYLLSLIKKAKLIFNVSDLWPASVVELGVISENSFMHKVSSRIEAFIYKKAWLVTGQSKMIVNQISQRFPNTQTYHLSNGVNPDLYESSTAHTQTGKIKFLYAGLHGLAQGLEIILHAADSLRERKNIEFSFIGDGPEKAKLINLSHQLALENVKFYHPLPAEDVPAILTTADVLLVPLKIQLTGAVPSKLYEAMAAAKPIILIAGSEAAEIVSNAQCGIVVIPQDLSGLCKAIELLASDQVLREEMGRNGRLAVATQFNRKLINQRFSEYLRCK